MQAFCEDRGIRFYHFLQPNQYVPRSKPFAPGERELARRRSSPFRHHVQNGYPCSGARGGTCEQPACDFTTSRRSSPTFAILSTSTIAVTSANAAPSSLRSRAGSAPLRVLCPRGTTSSRIRGEWMSANEGVEHPRQDEGDW